MANYKLSNDARDDLIRIHQYGVRKFGIAQADKYFHAFFDYFETIAERPFAFEAVDFIKPGYRRCPCGFDTIYYKIENDVVLIMSIIGRQDFDKIV